MSMRLYPPELLDALQARSGWSDEKIDAYLLWVGNVHRGSVLEDSWHGDTESYEEYIHSCVIDDIKNTLTRY